jgi:hypothetical protein
VAFIVASVPYHDQEHDSMEGAMFWLLAVTSGIAMIAVMVVDEVDWRVRLRERQMIFWDD